MARQCCAYCMAERHVLGIERLALSTVLLTQESLTRRLRDSTCIFFSILMVRWRHACGGPRFAESSHGH